MSYNPFDHHHPDHERDAISIFMKNLGNGNADPGFESDASVFSAGGEKWLFSTDEFSEEDNFRSHDAQALGWNVAAATISDILAAGGEPAYYGHSVTIQKEWDSHYLDRFSRGISHCLQTAGAEFLGGDLGISDKWKYTGIVMGRRKAFLSRRGARAGDAIYMTGHVGAGNLEAALRIYSGYASLKPLLDMVRVRFPLRIREAELVRKYAHCCIDSSDGVFRALQDLTRISATGFEISDIPYHKQGSGACRILGKPREILFLGECGEYELIFTIDPGQEHGFLGEAREGNLEFLKLGVITDRKDLVLKDGKTTTYLTGYSIFARNYPDVKEYIEQVMQFLKSGKG